MGFDVLGSICDASEAHTRTEKRRDSFKKENELRDLCTNFISQKMGSDVSMLFTHQNIPSLYIWCETPKAHAQKRNSSAWFRHSVTDTPQFLT